MLDFLLALCQQLDTTGLTDPAILSNGLRSILEVLLQQHTQQTQSHDTQETDADHNQSFHSLASIDYLGILMACVALANGCGPACLRLPVCCCVVCCCNPVRNG